MPVNLSRKDIQAIDAAKAYYGGLPQNEVAARLGVSRPTVSKLLRYARAKGYVKITVNDPRLADSSTAKALMTRFGLEEAVVVYPSAPADSEVRKALGEAGARMVEKVVKDGDTVGVSWSRTIEEISKNLTTQPRKKVQIVQLRGGVGGFARGQSEIEAVNRFAEAFNAQAHLLGAPTVFQSAEAKQAMMKEQQVAAALKRGRESRIAVFTVGDAAKSSYLLSLPTLSRDVKLILEQKAVGDICSRFIDTHGRVCLSELNDRTMAITLAHLRRIPEKIMVAGGDAKVAIIRVALEHGYANRLVIDAATAAQVLDMRAN